jgi:hypothetical protein
MLCKPYSSSAIVVAAILWFSGTAAADVELVNTGLPDGKLGALSTPANGSQFETEAADDFTLNSPANITGGMFYGLIPAAATVSDISQVVVEIYRVFPNDSDTVRTPDVPTRTNSPSDVAFDSADSVLNSLTFTATSLGAFAVANSVVNGINPKPTQTTGGEGAVSGQEVAFDFELTTPFMLPAGHYFFVPQVVVPGDFLWLSVPRPIVAPGTPFLSDLQAWIRNENLAPDWLRIGTDVVGPPRTGGPAPTFNMAFALDGVVTPEPTALPVVLGILAIVAWKRSRFS